MKIKLGKLLKKVLPFARAAAPVNPVVAAAVEVYEAEQAIERVVKASKKKQ